VEVLDKSGQIEWLKAFIVLWNYSTDESYLGYLCDVFDNFCETQNLEKVSADDLLYRLEQGLL
jgi:hypothetical protein